MTPRARAARNQASALIDLLFARPLVISAARVTNIVAVTYTNWLERPAIVAGIGAAGTVVDTFVPGVGTLISLALAGLYGAWARLKNRKVNEALVQGVETARAVLTTTAQGQAVDAQVVKWLMEHQKEAGVFATVSGLVDQLSDNPAAKMTAQEIADRVQKAQGKAAA